MCDKENSEHIVFSTFWACLVSAKLSYKWVWGVSGMSACLELLFVSTSLLSSSKASFMFLLLQIKICVCIWETDLIQKGEWLSWVFFIEPEAKSCANQPSCSKGLLSISPAQSHTSYCTAWQPFVANCRYKCSKMTFQIDLSMQKHALSKHHSPTFIAICSFP